MSLFHQPFESQMMKRCFSAIAVCLALVCALPVSALKPGAEAGERAEADRIEALAAPDNATIQQVEVYLAALDELMADESLLKEEPIAKVVGLAEELKAISVLDMRRILETLEVNTDFNRFRKNPIYKHDPKIYKPIVIAGLNDHPANIVAIKHYGWYADAKALILRKLDETKKMEQMAWWQAFVEVAEPKHYPKLKELLLTDYDWSADRPRLVMSLLKMLPDYDLLDTAQAMFPVIDQWIEEVERGERFGCRVRLRTYRRAQMSIAAQAGDVEMLGRLIDDLATFEDTNRIWYYSTNRIDARRDYVKSLIDFKGSNEAIKEWYEANRDQLVFDTLRKRFVLEEEL